MEQTIAVPMVTPCKKLSLIENYIDTVLYVITITEKNRYHSKSFIIIVDNDSEYDCKDKWLKTLQSKNVIRVQTRKKKYERIMRSLVWVLAAAIIIAANALPSWIKAQQKNKKIRKPLSFKKSDTLYYTIPVSRSLQRNAVLQFVFTNNIPMHSLQEPDYNSSLWGIVITNTVNMRTGRTLTNINVLTVKVEPMPGLLQSSTWDVWNTGTDTMLPRHDIATNRPLVIPMPEVISYLKKQETPIYETKTREPRSNLNFTIDLSQFKPVLNNDQMLHLLGAYETEPIGETFPSFPYHHAYHFPQVERSYRWDSESKLFIRELSQSNILRHSAQTNFPAVITHDYLMALSQNYLLYFEGHPHQNDDPPIFRQALFPEVTIRYRWNEKTSEWNIVANTPH